VSIGELRAALAGVGGLTAEARGHVQAAAGLLAEAAGMLADLARQSGAALPAAEFAQVQEDTEALVRTLDATGDAVADLGDRL
jgi:hypothetical protein